jgi:hypothetical protein
MKCLSALFGALLVFGLQAAPARADEAAQKFVDSIYQQYVGKDAPGVALDSSEALLQYFTPELAALIAMDMQLAEKNNEPPALDSDPFVDGQDWDIKSFSADVKDTGPDTAAGVVTMDNMDAKRTVELALKKTPAGWRIDDISWAEGTLRGINSDDGDDQKNEDTLPDTRKL